MRVDPALLNGFTIHFYTSTAFRLDKAKEQLQGLASHRGIQIVIHESVSHEVLLAAMCSAKGAIHYASRDQNPRSLYEFLVAGLPVFITEESRIPEVVKQQEFVFLTSYSETATLEDNTRKINEDFERFMKYVDATTQTEIDGRIDDFVENVMTEENAYGSVCVKLGICAS